MKIGKKLKLLRKDRKMTLKELSEKSNVAIATLSRMEHDIMTGTLESHINICKTLGVSLADFYREIESEYKTISLMKHKDKHMSLLSPKKSIIEILTTKSIDKKMMPVLIRLKKGGQTDKEENKEGTEKFVYMLGGSIIAEIRKEKYKLNKGDSLHFDASLPHQFMNDSKSNAVAICISSPPAI